MSRHVADHVFQSVAGGDTLFCDVVSYSEKTDIAFCSVKVYDKIALVGVDVTAIAVCLRYKICIIEEVGVRTVRSAVVIYNIAVLGFVRSIRKKRNTCGKNHRGGHTASEDLRKLFPCLCH